MEEINNNVCTIVLDKGYGCFEDVLQEKNIYDSVLIISDSNVYNAQGDNFIKNLKSKIIYEYIVSPGEDTKSLDVYEKIIEYCVKVNLSRKSVIIALGGGVVGDLAGFVASTYMRGIDVIQVPTTLLAQVDSSIGGKTGINIGNFKNIIGSFYQPKFTYINVDALKTLPENEFKSGMSEVIKYSLIYDYYFLDYLIDNSKEILNKDIEKLYYIVKKCANIKAEVVGNDEKEGGLRKILNFGHTFGHGVEKLCKISHGNAVSIGMNMAFKLSLRERFIEEEYYNKFLKVCESYDLPIAFENADEQSVLNIMKSDKKNSFSKINLVLPVGLGKVEVVDNISEDLILDIIRECKNA
ncbi:3-dehydroquinate synthase [Romboutsia ilealis]|uniref:3-dehydroquinate synthase n=1 Tax=Romboutsia faecis TaxID=2764597 RepID=A0ABR7JLW7_9FIRM|nr:3-dehydroquinate synthase [Romboutsia faecis]MBC5995913.1 3-dehydroquinate synthase [Romboutsia faecis]MRN23113.1 3-dehydroquinate synthase [Romboutsia ilealis]